MNYSELRSNYENILDAINSDRLQEALEMALKLSASSGTSDVQNRYSTIANTYKSMLKFSIEQAPDPQRDIIYNKLQQSILEWTDDIKDQWIRNNQVFERNIFQHRTLDLNSFSSKEIDQYVTEFSYESEGNEDMNKKEEAGNRQNTQLIKVNNLFYTFWLKNIYGDAEKQIFTELIKNNDVRWQFKALIVSALSLSLMRHFDRGKFFLLFDLIDDELIEIRQRSIVGLFLCLLIYEKRLGLYSDIIVRLKSIPDNTKLQESFLAVLLQFIRSSETEKITKTIQEEIVPEVMKIKSDLEEKLNLDDLLNKDSFEDKNPEWKNFFKDAPDVYQKLEQFSRLQTEGSDVFMGAFSMLKHFVFFKEMANWFLPFSGNHPDLANSFKNIGNDIDINAFTEGLEKSTILCNSDKYSFCFNIQFMPDQQRKTMLELFNMELKTMNELQEDEFNLNSESRNKVINTQYIQDLYRFFKLYPQRKEFEDVFSKETNVLCSNVLNIIFKENKIVRNLAEFYFAKDQYNEALKLFDWLLERERSFELLEKMGFCYQKLGDFDKAIELYQQAELYDRNKLWLYKKLGFCYRKTGNSPKAIEYYDQIIKSEPNDLNNLAYLGHLHMDTEEFEKALEFYYKVEYEDPKNIKVFRPIAWCSFVMGKYDTAIRYLKKAMEKKPVKSDYLNIGHCYWATGKMEMVLDSYRKAVEVSGKDIKWFRRAFEQDSKYLKLAGIESLDIALMIDYVLIV
ncbi:MAG: tetratricopeptide repeat protein [Bacteroidales bacterium]|nr:tetratricopeptide repeat protein [Bacteroidales bacterium]